MPKAGGEQIAPVISVDESNGLITATAGDKSTTLQLAFQAAQTITPGTTNQTIASGRYLTGTQTIKGDANLVASNIVSGKSIFGVVGTASVGGSGDTSIEDSLIEGTLTTYTNDRVTSIGGHAFRDCRILTSVSFPSCTSIGGWAFRDCRTLTSVSFPKCTSIDREAFYYCSNLPSVSFPVCTSIGSYAFGYCSKLTSLRLPMCSVISGTYNFYGCRMLTTLILGSNTLCILSNSNAFGDTPIAGQTSLTNGAYGTIYVPASLLTSYQNATNWAYFSSRFATIESLESGS